MTRALQVLTMMALVFLPSIAAVAQAPVQKDDQKVIQSALLRCQSQMLSVQADVVEGKLSDVASFVKRFEAANPGQTLDATLKAVAKEKK